MEQKPHPTHHQGYYATIVPLYGLSLVGLAVVGAGTMGVFGGGAGTRHVLQATGVLLFFGPALLAGVKVLAHGFARCPGCHASLRRSHVDDVRTYYPCERCGIVWTCDCHRTSD